MPKRFISVILLFGALGFVTVGDIFLPRPWSSYSRNTREQINRLMLSLMPKPTPEPPSQQRGTQQKEFLRRVQPDSEKKEN
ncbi:MAG: hypothetical protein ACK47N_22145 [Microcystis sp.]|jgi:hypothetical protein|uniref:hypothetical protein n=1 Tax=Microcystis TaxID=1125 RepID=UPI000E387734|nr:MULTISPECIES: hypothetical protein [Microcystis]NCQ89876.1 hypothetical protein [Microcystis aeruginosa LG13-13]NCR02783.1 hypothetical protein [Microcystis aeruginosa LG13-03]NCR60909.1 hypothetical protein [Microcystis aeruginosa LG11-05]REJ56959.1 MAG: hypothetical protein DWQ58_06055 [Microcystis aeruginosa TA09]MBD2290183.1 hypothetical protein [Microcystis wesenbergii FACHB-1317]